jgi:hypothetical protein
MNITSPFISPVPRVMKSQPTKRLAPSAYPQVSFSGDYPTEFFQQAINIGITGWALLSAAGLGAIALLSNRDKSSK